MINDIEKEQIYYGLQHLRMNRTIAFVHFLIGTFRYVNNPPVLLGEEKRAEDDKIGELYVSREKRKKSYQMTAKETVSISLVRAVRKNSFLLYQIKRQPLPLKIEK